MSEGNNAARDVMGEYARLWEEISELRPKFKGEYAGNQPEQLLLILPSGCFGQLPSAYGGGCLAGTPIPDEAALALCRSRLVEWLCERKFYPKLNTPDGRGLVGLYMLHHEQATDDGFVYFDGDNLDMALIAAARAGGGR